MKGIRKNIADYDNIIKNAIDSLERRLARLCVDSMEDCNVLDSEEDDSGNEDIDSGLWHCTTICAGR